MAGTNDHGDVLSISIGFELWNSYHMVLSPENLRVAILSHKSEYLKIQDMYGKEVFRVDKWRNGR